MRLKSSQAIEFRRKMIVKLYQEGKTQSEIAAIVELNQSQISIFLKSYRANAKSAIVVKKAKGNQAALSASDLIELKDLLKQGAQTHGYEGNYWNRSRVGSLIQTRWKVSFTERHVGTILKKIGYTIQRFSIKDFRQSREKVKDYLENTVPEIKKKAQNEARLIAFQDESGFQLTSCLGCSYAPKGQTPILTTELNFIPK